MSENDLENVKKSLYVTQEDFNLMLDKLGVRETIYCFNQIFSISCTNNFIAKQLYNELLKEVKNETQTQR